MYARLSRILCCCWGHFQPQRRWLPKYRRKICFCTDRAQLRQRTRDPYANLHNSHRYKGMVMPKGKRSFLYKCLVWESTIRQGSILAFQDHWDGPCSQNVQLCPWGKQQMAYYRRMRRCTFPCIFKFIKTLYFKRGILILKLSWRLVGTIAISIGSTTGRPSKVCTYPNLSVSWEIYTTRGCTGVPYSVRMRYDLRAFRNFYRIMYQNASWRLFVQSEAENILLLCTNFSFCFHNDVIPHHLFLCFRYHRWDEEREKKTKHLALLWFSIRVSTIYCKLYSSEFLIE